MVMSTEYVAVIEAKLLRGETFDQVEDYIEAIPHADPGLKSVLWLLAFTQSAETPVVSVTLDAELCALLD